MGGSGLQPGTFSAHPPTPSLHPQASAWAVVWWWGSVNSEERGWKLCTEVKGSVGWVRTEVGDPLYPEPSLLPPEPAGPEAASFRLLTLPTSFPQVSFSLRHRAQKKSTLSTCGRRAP